MRLHFIEGIPTEVSDRERFRLPSEFILEVVESFNCVLVLTLRIAPLSSKVRGHQCQFHLFSDTNPVIALEPFVAEQTVWI